MHLRRPITVASAVSVLVACIAIAAAAAPLASYDHVPVSGPWSLAPGEYYADIMGTSFRTGSGYDADGNLVSLGQTVEQRSFRSHVELGWTKRWSAQFTVPFATQTERIDGGTALSATGLEDFGVGLRFRLANGPRAAAVQLDWEAPAGYNQRLAPSVGDGLQKLSATLQLGGSMGRSAFWQLGGGMRIRYRSLAHASDQGQDPQAWKWPEHVIGNGAAGVWLGRLLAAGEVAVDASSFIRGEQTNKATSTAVGTRFTYRTDGRIDAFAGSWHTPSGRNALALNEYYAGIAWKSTKLNRNQGFLGGDPRP